MSIKNKFTQYIVRGAAAPLTIPPPCRGCDSLHFVPFVPTHGG
nr:MAG TPA: hypothetical protein [Caudoviricetes sp.]